MFIPKNMVMSGDNAIIDFIAHHGFALMVSPTQEATHLPLILEPSEGPQGVLYGHLAKANPHWKQLSGQRVLIVFQGPHAYISPTWYRRKPAVPTWNYAAVHCYGTVEFLDASETLASLEQLTAKYEPELLHANDTMPDEFVDKLSHAIVGIRIVLDDILAKEKLGQHRSQDDQQGVVAGLCSQDSLEAEMLVQYMRQRHLGTGE